MAIARLEGIPERRDAAGNRLAAAEGRLRALVAEVHQAASEVLVVAAETAAAARTIRPEVRAEGPRLLTVDQVADQLGISVSKAWQMVGSGEIASVNVGRTRRVRPEDLESYVAGL